jgi:hypothetical protein
VSGSGATSLCMCTCRDVRPARACMPHTPALFDCSSSDMLVRPSCVYLKATLNTTGSYDEHALHLAVLPVPAGAGRQMSPPPPWGV